MEIKYIKLVTGEDVLAGVEFNKELGVFKLNKPIRIVVTHEGLGMGPLSPFIKGKDVEVAKEHVVFIDEPDDQLMNAYNAQFGSGIVTASAGSFGGGIEIFRD